MNVNEKVRKIRLKNNMNKEEFARLIGVSARTVQRWEQNDMQIRESNLMKISLCFDIPIEYFEEDNNDNDK